MVGFHTSGTDPSGPTTTSILRNIVQIVPLSVVLPVVSHT